MTPKKSMQPHRYAYRPVVMGTRGAVTSAHPTASMAGISTLLAGGNAVDASIAVASTLNVVEPFMSGMGGVGLMIISNTKKNKRYILDFIGCSPQASDLTRCTKDELVGGPKSCATPGNLGGWLAALERFGTMPLSEVFAPAINCAERGVPLTWKNVEFFEKSGLTLKRSLEAKRIYLQNVSIRPGEIITYKDLASTFHQVVEGGIDAFYKGTIAKLISSSIQKAGGWLTQEDLSNFKPEWHEPISILYKNHEVISAPPPFFAFQILETLNIMEGYDLESWGHNSPKYLHHFIEAVKLCCTDRLAFAHRDSIPIQRLLSKGYAADQRARIDSFRASDCKEEKYIAQWLNEQMKEGYPPKLENECTTHFACADTEGWVVTVTQTLGSAFGSGVVVPGTGLLLNNSLKWMDHNPDSINRLRPSTKSIMMMSPTQVFQNNSFEISIGTPGSYGILQTTVQMLLNILEYGFNIQEAIEQPRVRFYRDRLIDVESRISSTTFSALANLGHQINGIDDWSWVVGGGQGICRDSESGALMAGADPRRDGYAMAI